MTVSRSNVIKLIVLIFIIAIRYFAYSGYKYFFSDINSEYQLAAIRDIKEITDIIDAEIEDLQNEEGMAQQDAEDKVLGDIPSAQKPDAPLIVSTAPDPQKIAAVKSVYEKGLLQLQEQGNAMVDGLLTSVKGEYAALKASGAGKSAILDLALSYMGRASAMEREIDAGFNAMISNLSSELSAVHMPEKEIVAYTTALQASYKSQKDQRRNIILDKAKSYL